VSSGPSDRISLGGQRRWAWLNKFSGGKSGYNNNGLGGNGARIFEIGFSQNGMGPGLLFSIAPEFYVSGERHDDCRD